MMKSDLKTLNKLEQYYLQNKSLNLYEQLMFLCFVLVFLAPEYSPQFLAQSISLDGCLRNRQGASTLICNKIESAARTLVSIDAITNISTPSLTYANLCVVKSTRWCRFQLYTISILRIYGIYRYTLHNMHICIINRFSQSLE